MKVTYLGHACVLLEMQGKSIIVDPFITGNALAKNIAIDEIKVDYIFITHGHLDHVLDVERISKNNVDALIVSNFEIVTWFEAKGLKGHPMNHGGKFEFSFGTAKYVNAIHSSKLPDGEDGGNPGGFVFYNDDECIYIAGDTALTRDMELIPMTCPKLDVAILPIGDNFTMGYEDARIASRFIECDKVIGYHYDTFPPIKLNKEKSIAYFAEDKKELILLEIGSSIEV